MAEISMTGAGGGGSAAQYLRIQGTPGEIDAALRLVEDQAGNPSILSLSLTEAQFSGTYRSVTDQVWWKGFDGLSNPRLEMYHTAQGIWMDNLSAPAIVPSTPLTESFVLRANDATNASLQKIFVARKGGGISLRKDDYYTTQNVAVIDTLSPASGWGIAIQPGTNAAFMLNVPNGAATGGNARGANAVDLQISRSAAGQVSSGAASFSAGASNTASALAAIAIGNTNTASAQFSAVLSGFNQTNNSYGGLIAGGDSNNITGGGNYSVISGGSSNNISSGMNNGIGSGQGNIVSADNAVISGGSTNAVTQKAGSIMGGENNTVQAFGGAVLGGLRGNAYLYGQKAHASGRFSIDGDAQGSEVILRRTTGMTTAAISELFLDGTSLRITANANGFMLVNVELVAVVTAIAGTATGVTVGDMFSQNVTCAYRNLAGVGSVVQQSSLGTWRSGSMSTANTAFAATGASLQINFTAPTFAGGGTLTMRIVAKARITETRY